MYNVLELLQNHGITTTKVATTKGGEYHSPCPGCGGTKRFHVWPEEKEGWGSYWCRDCGKWGDNIQFLIHFEGLDFLTAKRQLGMVVDDDYRRSRPARTSPKTQVWKPQAKGYPAELKDKELWRQKAQKFVNACHLALLDNPGQLAWLAGRGIPLEYVKKYMLGWHATKGNRPSFRPRTSWGLSGGNHPKTNKPFTFILPAGVVIPWYAGGNLRRVQIRLAVPDPKFPKKKYHFVKGSAMDTFVTAFNAQAYVVQETVLDAIMVDAQAGDLAAACSLASVSTKPTATAAKSLLAADRVLNALDFDHAGKQERPWWEKNFPNSVRHPVPQGGDPGEAYELGVSIRDWVWCGLPASMRISPQGEILSSPPPRPAEVALPALVVPEHLKKAKPQEAAFTTLPPEVVTLAALLKSSPLWIENTADITAVHPANGFDRQRHRAIQDQIADLLFTDAVMDHLAARPEVIHAGNFIERGVA